MKDKKVVIALAIIIVIASLFIIPQFATVYDFRKTQYDVVFEGADGRCVEQFNEEVTIPVAGSKSRYPSFTLKTIGFTVGDSNDYDNAIKFMRKGDTGEPWVMSGKLFSKPVYCYGEYEIGSSQPPSKTVYSEGDIKPCSEFIGCNRHDANGLTIDPACSNEGKKRNPYCPVLYYPYSGLKKETLLGVVVYDSEFGRYMCRVDVFSKPYECFSDMCIGRNIILKDANVCVSNVQTSASRLFNDVFVKKVVVEPVDESDIPFIDKVIINPVDDVSDKVPGGSTTVFVVFGLLIGLLVFVIVKRIKRRR